MRHFRLRYSLDKLPVPMGHPDLIYAVIDHQKGQYVARGLTWDGAHNLIDKLEGVVASPEPEEYPELSDGWRHRSNARSGMFG